MIIRKAINILPRSTIYRKKFKTGNTHHILASSLPSLSGNPVVNSLLKKLNIATPLGLLVKLAADDAIMLRQA